MNKEGEEKMSTVMTRADVVLASDKRYSRSERELFSLMPKDGTKISSIALSEKRKKKFDWDIDNPRNVVIVTMDQLRKKIIRNKEPFRLVKTEKRLGPYPTEFWIEMR
jgi:hypothetical protein